MNLTGVFQFLNAFNLFLIYKYNICFFQIYTIENFINCFYGLTYVYRFNMFMSFC